MSLKQVAISYLRNPRYILKNLQYRLINSPSKAEHIFVVGAPRSGTTLIQSVLSCHDSITSFDEETGFFMYRDFFLKEYEGIKRNRYKELIGKSSDMVSLFDSIAQERLYVKEKATFFLEKTPQHVLYISKLIQLFPKSKFVNVYRDVRDSSISAMNFAGIEQGTDLTKFVRYWQKCIRARKAVKSELILDVKYEDFVKSPEIELKKIMSFLNLKYETKQLDANVFSKNSRAGKEGFKKLTKPIDASSVGKWEHNLSDKNLQLIYKLAEDELKYLEYHLS